MQARTKCAGHGNRLLAQAADDLHGILASHNPAKVGEHIGLPLRGSDRAQLTSAFEGLADGGQVKMPLSDQPWGTSGWLTDKFGINWNFDIEKS